MHAESDEHLVRYLLGELPEAEAEALDERSIIDDAVALRLRALENDLIDRYVRGGPFDAALARFDRIYRTSPHLRDKVRFAKALAALTEPAAAGKITTTPGPRWRPVVSWWAVPVAASLVVLIAAALFLRSESNRETVAVQSKPAPVAPSAPPATGPVEPPRPESVDPSRAAPTPSPSSPVVVTVSISPVLVRSADQPATISIASRTTIVRLLLRGAAGEQLVRGRAVITTVTGEEVWRGPATPLSDSPQQELARVDVPAASLSSDDYIILLFGTDAAGREAERYRYFVRVEKP